MIFFAEAKRLFLNRRMLAAVILILAVALFWTKTQVDNTFRFQEYEAEYLEYCEKWQGELTEAKRQEIEAEALFIETTLAQQQEKEQLYERGKISREEYTEFLGDRVYALQHEGGFRRFYEQYQRASALSGNPEEIRPMLLYDSYWNELFKDYPTVLLLFLLVFAVVPFVVNDYTSDMWRIIKPTRKGIRKLLMVRLLVALLFCVIVHGVFSGAQYILMERLYALPCSSFPVQSIGIFQNLQQAFTIAQYYIVLSLLRTLFFVILCIIIFSLALLFKNMILSISVILGASLLPVASRTVAQSLYLYSPVSVLYVNDLLAYQASPATVLIVFGVYGGIAAALFAAMLKWRV